VGAIRAKHEPGREPQVASVALTVEVDAAVLSLDVDHSGSLKVGAGGLGLLAEQFVQSHPVYGEGAGVAAADGQFAATCGVDVGPAEAVGRYRLAHVRLFQGARAD
jgi:hypothetical protein